MFINLKINTRETQSVNMKPKTLKSSKTEIEVKMKKQMRKRELRISRRWTRSKSRKDIKFEEIIYESIIIVVLN